MGSDGENDRLRRCVERARDIVDEALALEIILFEDRFNGSFTGDIEYFERWQSQHHKVSQALAES